jgi:uncharacterized membrane protein YoaK (UPF0700 family)
MWPSPSLRKTPVLIYCDTVKGWNRLEIQDHFLKRTQSGDIQHEVEFPQAAPDHELALPLFQEWLPILLSVIAGMVDVIGFLSLGMFTAHVTGNIAVIGALMVHHNRVSPADILAIPVFVLAVAATWLIAKATCRRYHRLMRLLLMVQFLLITSVLIFSVITKPSADPDGIMATIAAMLAVSSMACQFALLRLALPVAPSTAVMTGNLTNAVLAFIDSNSRKSDRRQLRSALHLLIGFFFGCVAAAAAELYLGDWAWSLPTAVAAVALALSATPSRPEVECPLHAAD